MNLEGWIIVWLQIGAICLVGGLISRSRLTTSAKKAVARWTFVALPVVLALNVFSWRSSVALPEAPITVATPVASYVEVAAPILANPPAVPIVAQPEGGTPRYWSLADLLIAGWIFGAAFPIIRLGFGLILGYGMRRRTHPAPAALIQFANGNPVRVGPVPEPMLAGLLRPTIYLPTKLVDSEPDDRLRAIILHEVGHIQGKDLPWRFAARILTALLWPQPLVKWAERGLIQADEDRCDEEVLAAGVSSLAYASMLVSIAEKYRGRFGSADAAAFSSGLKRRVKALVSGRRKAASRMSRRGHISVGVIQLAVLCSALLGFGALPAGQGGIPEYKPLDHAIQVTIQDVDGKPVSEIVVYGQGSNYEGRHAAVKLQAVNGVVTIDPKLWPKESPFVFLLAKSANSSYTVHLAWDGKQERTSFRLAAKTRVTGRFLDVEGKPLANQRMVTDFLASRGEDDLSTLFEMPKEIAEFGKTDSQGQFTIDCFPMNATFLLDCPDYTLGARANRRVRADKPVTDLGTIRMERGAVVEGRITRDGKPAAGIEVGAQSDGDWGSAITDGDGRYRILRLPSGSFNVALKLSDNQQKEFTAPAREGVKIAPGQTISGMNFALIPGGILRGRITQAGKPKAGVMVGVYGPAHPQSGAWVQNTKTDAKGEYMTRVPAGRQHVYIMEDFGDLRDLGTMADVDVVDGKETRVDLVYPGQNRSKPH